MDSYDLVHLIILKIDYTNAGWCYVLLVDIDVFHSSNKKNLSNNYKAYIVGQNNLQLLYHTIN